MNAIQKQMFKQMIFWTIVGIGISYGINVIMFSFLGDAAFPWNLILIITLFLVVGYLYQRRQLKKAGLIGQGSSVFKYECNQCGTSFKGERCPKCGNRGGRAIFGI